MPVFGSLHMVGRGALTSLVNLSARARRWGAAVSGADPIEVRPGFVGLLARIADNGVRMIIVETANRFARPSHLP
jgi:hypothetical protein